MLADWDPYDQNKFAGFFDMDWMFGIRDGFDIAIGNPPYVQIQKFSGKQEQKDWESQKYKTYTRTGDIYCLFYEKGNMLLRNKGVLTFITSNKWMRANYGKLTRKYFAEKTNPLQIVDFGGYKVFESATVDTNILILEKSKNKKSTAACKIKNDFIIDTNISEYVNSNSITLSKLSEESWIIASKEEQRIKDKIEKIGTPLKDWDISIYRGILTGYNKAFIIDGAKKDELIAADPKNAGIIKPVLRGRDIKRYKAEFADLWLIFIPWHFPLHNDSSVSGASKKAEKEFKKQFPYIYSHLLKYKEKLSKRNKAETGIRYEWYVLQRCAASYYNEFEKEKIVWQEMTQENSFAYDENLMFCNDTGRIMTGKNLKFLIAILNSPLIHYAFGNFYAGGALGEKGVRYKHTFMEQLPIPKIPTKSQTPFITLVDLIIAKKEKGEDTTAEENKIDIMVYKLYELTYSEVKIIDPEIEKIISKEKYDVKSIEEIAG
jgi:type II restriction/modification system DNA methylase subunit YeeA